MPPKNPMTTILGFLSAATAGMALLISAIAPTKMEHIRKHLIDCPPLVLRMRVASASGQFPGAEMVSKSCNLFKADAAFREL